ncbi:hypothetical protein VULLAG_LOCUS6084 [Vulpes lagopus]
MLFVGDAILQVNGVNVENATHGEVVSVPRLLTSFLPVVSFGYSVFLSKLRFTERVVDVEIEKGREARGPSGRVAEAPGCTLRRVRAVRGGVLAGDGPAEACGALALLRADPGAARWECGRGGCALGAVHPVGRQGGSWGPHLWTTWDGGPVLLSRVRLQDAGRMRGALVHMGRGQAGWHHGASQVTGVGGEGVSGGAQGRAGVAWGGRAQNTWSRGTGVAAPHGEQA